MSSAIENPRVSAAIEHYLLDLENTQPKNTRRSYLPKQEEWKHWCQVNWPAIPKVWPAPVPQGQQLPGDLVDEGKLLLFMKEVVMSRPPRKGKRVTNDKKRHLESQEVKRAVKWRKTHPAAAANTTSRTLTLSRTSLRSGCSITPVRGYVSAIQKLYDEQKSWGVNPAARPQGVALKALKRSILATAWNRKRKEYTDRGVGTLRDVYAPAQIPDHTNVAWSERKEIACALRTQVDFLFGNHMLLRSGNRLPMELAYCFPLDLPNEGLKVPGYTTKAQGLQDQPCPEWPRRRTPTLPAWMKDRHVITLTASRPPPASPA
ncbi:hypothetical protein HIM_12334 [Hirsutella minnesotensis 3608]|uniref:Ndc10 domain-containing protein n=1 Tax=Hirsutella minnesotensis 3608 TaxID=1043627 RepID=A0A0F7ZI57_9HYPO|nr:hypothetical protein HIM_12334 [Hirsutella minnesotensis 3608]